MSVRSTCRETGAEAACSRRVTVGRGGEGCETWSDGDGPKRVEPAPQRLNWAAMRARVDYIRACPRDVLGGRSVADVAIVPQWMTKIDGRTSRGS